MKGEQVFAGISCSGVLQKLSAFIDDELSACDRDQIVAHLKRCTACARFGDEFTRVVEAARNTGKSADASVMRLLDRLADL